MRSSGSRIARFAAATVAVAYISSLGGCFLDTGACRYEHRTLVLEGSVDGPLGVEVSLNETRGSDPDFRVLNLQVTSGQFAGAILSAELRDVSTSPAQVVAEWSTLISNSAVWGANLELPAGSPSHEMLATLARAGRLQVAILLGPADAPSERTGALAVATDGDWHHPRCD